MGSNIYHVVSSLKNRDITVSIDDASISSFVVSRIVVPIQYQNNSSTQTPTSTSAVVVCLTAEPIILPKHTNFAVTYMYDCTYRSGSLKRVGKHPGGNGSLIPMMPGVPRGTGSQQYLFGTHRDWYISPERYNHTKPTYREGAQQSHNTTKTNGCLLVQ